MYIRVCVYIYIYIYTYVHMFSVFPKDCGQRGYVLPVRVANSFCTLCASIDRISYSVVVDKPNKHIIVSSQK